MQYKQPCTIGLVTIAFIAGGITISSARAGIVEDFFSRLFNVSPPAAAPRGAPPEPYDPPIDYEEAVIRAVESASPAVISIVVSKHVPIIENCSGSSFGNLPPEFQEFFGPFEFQELCEQGTARREVGGGSGFIVSEDGLIVTNRHVVSDESASYTVFTNDGKKHDASVLARDPLQDIAIVKIDPPAGGLPVVRLGNSDSVRLGQTAVAIGNAFGEFRNTVSVGIVSGLARDIDAGGGGIVEHLEGLIQTDAAINPGNSGGPLLNLRGEVIGMNTAVAAGAENIGFSIPINNIRRDIDSVQRSGRIIIPFLGVRYLLIDGVVAEAENLPVQYGAILRGSGESSAIVPDSPAAAAGLMAEDIVLAVNGMPVTPTRSLSATIQQYAVGDTVALTVLRAGRELQIPVTLAEREF